MLYNYIMLSYQFQSGIKLFIRYTCLQNKLRNEYLNL